MKRIILIIAALAALADCLHAATDYGRPVGWATCASIDGGRYALTGGGGGRSVILTGGPEDSRAALEDAIKRYDVIILDGSKGPFVVSSYIAFEDLKGRTIAGINGAEIRTMFELNDELRSLIKSKVPEGLSSTSGGGTLSNGKAVREENAFQTRQILIDYTGDQDESYQRAGLFKFWSGCENIIIRNIAFVGPGAMDIDGCHLVEFAYGANHVWVDHCSFIDAQRTAFYLGVRSNFVTVTWCTFDYTDRSFNHCLASLIGGQDDAEKYGEDCLNATFAWCSFGRGVEGRTPMVRFGNVHCVNNYYNCPYTTIDPRTDSEVRVERCYFERRVAPIAPRVSGRLPAKAYEYVDNYSASGAAFKSDGSVSMPYSMAMMDARSVKRAVQKGAGPILADPLDIGAAPDAEVLYNGIALPETWPPRYTLAGAPAAMPLPYLEHRPETIVINVGRQLFVDDFLIESTDMVRVNHHARMYEGNPVIAPDCPTDFRGEDRMADPYSGGVWYDEKDGLFKVWYRSGEGVNPSTGRRYLFTGYAVSEDGLHWTKPELDVLPGTNVTDTLDHDSRSVWLDKTEPDPAKRFKSVYVRCGDEKSTKYDLKYSTDGVHWGPTQALSGRMQDRSTVNWNPFRQKWIASLRICAPMNPSIRGRCYMEDSDIESLVNRVHWVQNELDLVRDSALTGYTLHDPEVVYWFDIEPDEKHHPFPEYSRILPAIYNFDATAYESVMLGQYSSWKGPENYICAEHGIQKLNEYCLGYSRDGFHYFRPDKEPVMESRQEEGAWNWGNMQPAIGNPCIVGDSLYLYCGGHRRNDINWDGWTSTGLGILRRDGFVSMHTDTEGTILTPPVKFDGGHFFVNAKAAGLAVEVLTSDGKPLKGYAFKDCKTLRDIDGTKVRVEWRRSLGKLAGSVVRFRFRVERGDLYSFWVSLWETGESRGFTGGGGPGLHPSGIDLPLDLPEAEVRSYVDSFKPYERVAPVKPLGRTFHCSDPMLQTVYDLLVEARLKTRNSENCHRKYMSLNGVPNLEKYNPGLAATLRDPQGWTPDVVTEALDWFYSALAGVVADKDFSHVAVEPSFPKGIEFVKAEFDTSAGTLHVSWETGGVEPRLRITAPVGVEVSTSYTAPQGSLITFAGDGLDHDFPSLMKNR